MSLMIFIPLLIPDYADSIVRAMLERCESVKPGWDGSKVVSTSTAGAGYAMCLIVEPRNGLGAQGMLDLTIDMLKQLKVYHHGVIIVEGWQHCAARPGNIPMQAREAPKKPEPPPDPDSLEGDWQDVKGKPS